MTRTSIQIRWSDIDLLGHVYNGQYQHFFDIGKSDFFNEVLQLEHNWVEVGEGFLTAQTLNNYFAPIEMHEPIEAITAIEKVGTKSFTMLQRLVNTLTGQVKSESRSVIVCYNTLTKQSIPVPDKWRAAMQNHIVEQL